MNTLVADGKRLFQNTAVAAFIAIAMTLSCVFMYMLFFAGTSVSNHAVSVDFSITENDAVFVNTMSWGNDSCWGGF